MRILMLAHRFPYPPVQGDSVRCWNEVEHLSRRHELWLACCERRLPCPEHRAHVRRRCRALTVVARSPRRCLLAGAARLLSGGSVTEGYFYNARLARVVQRWGLVTEFDAVLTFSPAMSVYAQLVAARRRVLDMNDVESEKWRSYAQQSWPPLAWLYALEARRVRRREAEWLRGHDVSLVVNARELAKAPADLHARMAVLPTGVAAPLAARSATLPAAPVIGFVGSLSYAPNVRAVIWFARHVWPLVRAAAPAARWLIIGNRPCRRVRRWAHRPRITVTGFVPDVQPMLQSLRVFVCPAREQIGVQTKLIQALAAGRPAVVTPWAAGGMDYDDPPPFLIASSPADFAAAVLRLCRDDALARSLADRARAVAATRYSLADQMARLERWLQDVAGGQAEAHRHLADDDAARRGPQTARGGLLVPTGAGETLP